MTHEEEEHKSRIRSYDNGRDTRWTVNCSCGWGSTFHTSEQEALDAHSDHQLAVNR